MSHHHHNSTEDHDLRHLARRVFQAHYQAMVSQEAGVSRGEVEAVHDMRVATRRFRAALGNFAVCCDPEVRQRMRARLGRLAETLGAVRDLDVMIAALKSRQPELLPEQRSSLRGLIRRLQARRLRRRRRLREYLQTTDYAELGSEVSRLIGEAADRSEKNDPTGQAEAQDQTEAQDKDGEGIQG